MRLLLPISLTRRALLYTHCSLLSTGSQARLTSTLTCSLALSPPGAISPACFSSSPTQSLSSSLPARSLAAALSCPTSCLFSRPRTPLSPTPVHAMVISPRSHSLSLTGPTADLRPLDSPMQSLASSFPVALACCHGVLAPCTATTIPSFLSTKPGRTPLVLVSLTPLPSAPTANTSLCPQAPLFVPPFLPLLAPALASETSRYR